ncbi:PREDICTED: uncharacterized protein LOC108368279 isoform X2 [Rhagoletis zephyria]|uniref:uncharacterized protein LOC108368279 isoform X2 n=1 Tax=Rhagoletis zephyria TaxID=28612 RepID=UPI0008116208|nr:PREDICTED: uncharacterized protein LOC108368279 isoform X2 [Rhagoletis zephyria]
MIKKQVKKPNKILEQIVNKEKNAKLIRTENNCSKYSGGFLLAIIAMSAPPKKAKRHESSKRTCHLCEQLNEKCDKLYEKLSAMEEKSRQQSDKFCDILAEHKVLLMELTHQNKALQTLKGIFPIKSTEELKNLDELLEIQPEIYVRHMKTLIASNLNKNLSNVIANNLIMDYNLDGTHSKHRLKDFKNVYFHLIEAISLSEDHPEEKLRIAMHKEKKKSFRKPKDSSKKMQFQT